MEAKVYYTTKNISHRKMSAILIENGYEILPQNVVNEPLSWEQLLEILMLTNEGFEDILTNRSREYRSAMNEGIIFDDLSITEMHELLKNRPKLLKSPITIAKGMLFTGYDTDAVAHLVSRDRRRMVYDKALNTIRQEEDKQTEHLMRDYVKMEEVV